MNKVYGCTIIFTLCMFLWGAAQIAVFPHPYDYSPANDSIPVDFVFSETFDGPMPFAEHSRQFAADHAFTIVEDPLLQSNNVGRFELRDTDPRATKTGIRAEVGFRVKLKEGWYAYSVYFPHQGYEKDNIPEIISQWHQSEGGSPPNAVQVNEDEIYLRSIHRSDTRDNSNKVYTSYPLGNVERGKWQEYVFHFIHSPDSNGLIEIWHNKKKIHTIKGPNMRRDFGFPYFKFGIYKWRWDNGGKTKTDVRVLYFDNVKVANFEASLGDMVKELHF